MAMAPIDQERHDLDTHVSLCAERYMQLEKKFDTLETKLADLEKKIDTSKSTIFTTLVVTGGSIIVSLITAVSMILAALPNG